MSANATPFVKIKAVVESIHRFDEYAGKVIGPAEEPWRVSYALHLSIDCRSLVVLYSDCLREILVFVLFHLH